MKQDKKQIKKLTLNKTLISHIDPVELNQVRGGDGEASLIFTFCICMTRFCTATCP